MNKSEKKFPYAISGGLWMKKSKKGDDYLTGSLKGTQLYIYENKNRRNENDPHFLIYTSSDESGAPAVIQVEEPAAPTGFKALRKAQ